MEACLFAGMVGLRVAGAGPVPTVVGALEGMEVAERETEAGEAEDLEPASSSSLGFNNNEISTVEEVMVLVGGEYLKSNAGKAACTGLSTCASLNELFA